MTDCLHCKFTTTMIDHFSKSEGVDLIEVMEAFAMIVSSLISCVPEESVRQEVLSDFSVKISKLTEACCNNLMSSTMTH